MRIQALALVILLFSLRAQAQNVTASFNMSAFEVNPAATATRDFGIVSPILSMSRKHETLPSWTRETDINRGELLLAGRSTTFVPELYVSESQAQIDLNASLGTHNIGNSVSLFNGILNLGCNYSEHFKLGLTASNLNLDYKQKEDSGDATFASSLDGTVKDQITGIGLGATYLFGPFAIGGFYTKILDNINQNFTQILQGATPVNTVTNGNYGHEKYGLGLSFQIGSSKAESGYRIEISHTKVNFGGDGPLYTNDSGTGNAQTRIAIEASKFGFTGGLILTRTYGRYIDYKYFLDAVIAEFPYYSTPKDEYGGFFGFKSTSGNSVGVSGSYFKGDSPSKSFGQDVTAQTEQYSVSVNYAYAF